MRTEYVVGLPLGIRMVFSLDAEAALNEIRLRQSRLDDPAPLLNQIAGILRADARQQFAVGGDPAWAALKPATIAQKAKLGLPARLPSGRIPRRLMQNGIFGPQSILIRSGALRDSWGRKDSPSHVENIDPDAGTVSIGSSVPYAPVHQAGGKTGGGRSKTAADVLVKAGKRKPRPKSGGGGTLPARPVVVTDDARQQITEAVEDYFAAETGVRTFPSE